MDFAIHPKQTEGSCRHDREIHPGGLMVAEKSSIHIMQLFGLLREEGSASRPLSNRKGSWSALSVASSGADLAGNVILYLVVKISK